MAGYFVQCEVSEGPREGFKSVGIDSVQGHKEYLAIEERFLYNNGSDQWFLPIVIVGKDDSQDTQLIELPAEADSGTRRVWVQKEDVTDNPQKVLA